MSSRIEESSNILDALVAIAGGNPGAVTAIGNMIAINDKVDIASSFGIWGPVIMLDSFEIYESRVWLLFNDVAGRNPTKALTLLRATQMGIVEIEQLNGWIDGSFKLTDEEFDTILAKLRVELPEWDTGGELDA